MQVVPGPVHSRDIRHHACVATNCKEIGISRMYTACVRGRTVRIIAVAVGYKLRVAQMATHLLCHGLFIVTERICFGFVRFEACVI